MKLGGDNKMRNLKKIAAIVLAATMCLGVSATAFASGESQKGVIDVDVKDKEGNPVSVDIRDAEELTDAEKAEIAEDLYDETGLSYDKVSAILEKNGFTGLTKDMDLNPILLIDAKVNGATPDGGVSVVFSTQDAKGIEAGDTVYVMHKKHNGEWEVKKAVVGEDGFTVEFSELSPILVIKVTENGDTVVLKENKEVARYSGTTQKPVEVKQSPKTGE